MSAGVCHLKFVCERCRRNLHRTFVKHPQNAGVSCRIWRNHGCSWETFDIFACCGLVVEIRTQLLKFKLLLPFQRQPSTWRLRGKLSAALALARKFVSPGAVPQVGRISVQSQVLKSLSLPGMRQNGGDPQNDELPFGFQHQPEGPRRAQSESI